MEEEKSALPPELERFYEAAEKRGIEIKQFDGRKLLGTLPAEIRNINGEKVLVTMKSGKYAGKTVRGRAYFMDWGNSSENGLTVHTKEGSIINADFIDTEKLYVQVPVSENDSPKTDPYNTVLRKTFGEDVAKGNVHIECYHESDFKSRRVPQSVKRLSGEKTLAFVKSGDRELRTVSGEAYFEDAIDPSVLIDTSVMTSEEIPLTALAGLYIEQIVSVQAAGGLPVISPDEAAVMMGILPAEESEDAEGKAEDEPEKSIEKPQKPEVVVKNSEKMEEPDKETPVSYDGDDVLENEFEDESEEEFDPEDEFAEEDVYAEEFAEDLAGEKAEEDAEDLLAWRAADDRIPADVYEARMSRLSPPDRKTAENIFARYPGTLTLYFGYSKTSDRTRCCLDTMMRFASCGLDAGTCERLFNCSAWGDIKGNDATKILASRCVNLCEEMGVKIDKIYTEADKKMGEAPDRMR